MEIESSSLWREVESVLEGDEKPVHFSWRAEIHVKSDKGEEKYEVLKVLNIDFKEDYELQFGDEVMLRVAIPGGTYAKRIYPYQSKLDITLYRNPLLEHYDADDQERLSQVERYTATLIDTGNPVLDSSAVNSMTEEALDLANIFEINFQLVNKALEQLRLITVGGTWRDTTVQDAVKAILTTESRKVQVDDVRMPQGVDMVEASNTKKRDHITIPQGTRLVDVPQYIHERCGGIYRAGLGYYLRGDYWYLYPCYDTTRFFDVEKTLTVINVPSNKLPQVERTYRLDGNNLLVLATGETKFQDSSETRQLNEGNGIRFADADRFMHDFVETKDNRTLASRGRNNSEFISTARPSGNNNVQVSKSAITANPYVEYSSLARREGGMVALEWQNSDPRLLMPGMMVRLMYLEEEEVMETYGVLVKAHHYVHNQGKGLTEIRYRSSSVLSVFVKPLQSSSDFEEA